MSAQTELNASTTKDGPGPFLGLAPEIINNIIKQVDSRSDLSNTRLVCKQLDTHARHELFKEVLVSTSAEHVATWTSIGQDETLRRIPRHAIIHTQSDLEENGSRAYEDDGDEEVTDEFKAAVAALSRFPNLDSVEIGFTPECLGDGENNYWQDVVEDVARRQELLELIFGAIRDRASDPENRPIRKLTIINLQNCPIPEFTSSALFRDVMGSLDELHISLTQEYNEHGPDHDYTKVELRTFPGHFVSAWLGPFAANLKALSIYHRSDNWGPFPGFFDFSNLEFPKLETLALGYYTLAHDDDLDWILRIKSLRRLVLHNCMILSWIRIYDENMTEWGVRTHGWTPLEGSDVGDSASKFSYAGTWSTNLDRIAAELPNLKEFRFDQGSAYSSYGDESGRYGVLYRDNVGVRVFPKRYVVFDNGILPTHWPEAERNGELYSWLDDGWPENLHLKTLEKDQESLDRLLEKLKGTE